MYDALKMRYIVWIRTGGTRKPSFTVSHSVVRFMLKI